VAVSYFYPSPNSRITTISHSTALGCLPEFDATITNTANRNAFWAEPITGINNLASLPTTNLVSGETRVVSLDTSPFRTLYAFTPTLPAPADGSRLVASQGNPAQGWINLITLQAAKIVELTGQIDRANNDFYYLTYSAKLPFLIKTLSIGSIRGGNTRGILINTARRLSYLPPCLVNTNTNINLNSPGSIFNGITVSIIGTRIAVFAQTNTAQNGLYIWLGATTPMTRALDADTFTKLINSAVAIQSGPQAGVCYRQIQASGTINTSPNIWQVFSDIVGGISNFTITNSQLDLTATSNNAALIGNQVILLLFGHSFDNPALKIGYTLEIDYA